MNFKYACCSCGWRVDADESSNAADLLAAHVGDCAHPMRALNVPMWSVAWPWYWAVQKGEIPADHFGLEMAWRPVGSHSSQVPFVETGSSAKLWYLFPERAA